MKGSIKKKGNELTVKVSFKYPFQLASGKIEEKKVLVETLFISNRYNLYSLKNTILRTKLSEVPMKNTSDTQICVSKAVRFTKSILQNRPDIRFKEFLA